MKVSQTSAILCSILCLRFWRRPTEDWVSLCSTLFFSCPSLWIFSRYVDFVDTRLQLKQILFFTENYFGLCGVVTKVNETLGGWEANSHFPLRCPPHVGTNCWIFLSVQLPPAEMKGSNKADRDFKVGILNEDRRMNALGAEWKQPGRGEEGWITFFFIVN